jgi:hypothetical protein
VWSRVSLKMSRFRNDSSTLLLLLGRQHRT